LNFEASTKNAIATHVAKNCELKKHERHESKFTYFCALCKPGKVFQTSTLLNKHNTKEHESDRKENSEFICGACGKGFQVFRAFQNHFRQEGPFHLVECTHCHVKMESWTEHMQHINDFHNGKFLHRCGLCGVSKFESEIEKQFHRKFCKIHVAKTQVKVFGDGRVSCTICEEPVEADDRKVKHHLQEKHSDKSLTCSICGMAFSTKAYLRKHMLGVHTKRTFTCDTCNKAFKTKQALIVHKQSHSSADERTRLKCDHCEKTYLGKQALTKHVNVMHLNLPKPPRPQSMKQLVVCDLCGKEVTKDGFRKHMERVHSNQNVKCDQCDFVAPHINLMTAHKRNFHNPITCEECGETVQYLYFKKHRLMKHTPDILKPHVCPVCQKGFISIQRLQSHMNIHTGIRPFKCDYCVKDFTDSPNCFKHMREAHSVEYANRKKAKKTPTK